MTSMALAATLFGPEDLRMVERPLDPLASGMVRIRFGAAQTTQTSDEYMYWFDPESGEVVYFAYDFVGEPNGIRFRRAINPRRVGGILFFDQENVGLDGDGLDVGAVDPKFVAERLHPISVVALEDIQVRPLPVK